MDAVAAKCGPHKILFEAVVKPHRSLSRKNMLRVIGGMVTASLLVSSMMALLGAWPVIGFFGAEITLAVFLLWLNMRAERAREIISLSENCLEVSRLDVHGRRENFALAPYWLNVVLEERPGMVPKLLLCARQHNYEVARLIGEAQKRDLAAALNRALNRWRNPVFDNPQLR
jgi:uncharacterized membrane protein